MYPFLLIAHLLAAIAFIGTLFFEVVIWHRARQPLASSFGTLLSLKIILALSIIGHYLLLAYWLKSARLSTTRATWIRRSILAHMVLIVILAKAMFYWQG